MMMFVMCIPRKMMYASSGVISISFVGYIEDCIFEGEYGLPLEYLGSSLWAIPPVEVSSRDTVYVSLVDRLLPVCLGYIGEDVVLGREYGLPRL